MMTKNGIPKSEGCFRRSVCTGCGLRGLRAKGGIVVDDELNSSWLAAGRRATASGRRHQRFGPPPVGRPTL